MTPRAKISVLFRYPEEARNGKRKMPLAVSGGILI